MAKETRQMVPLPDAVQAIGCNYGMAWRAVLARRVPARRVGRAWHVHVEDLRVFMRTLEPAGVTASQGAV